MKELKGNRGRKKNTAEHRETEIGESFWLSPVRYRSSSIPQKSITAYNSMQNSFGISSY